MKLRPLTGAITALVTPFRNGEVAYDDLRKLVEYQIKGGIDGLVPVGTTGESPTLSHEENIEVVRAVVEAARGRVPVVAGTGSNSTAEAVELTRLAHAAGADAMLVVAPYYNKPAPEGLFRHFAAIADTTDRPIILYSIPGRCGIEIGVPVIERLRARYRHVRWIKEAGGSVDRVDQLKQALGSDVTVLSGDDSLTLPFMAVGAEGVISVASNLMVREISRMVREALANDFAAAPQVAPPALSPVQGPLPRAQSGSDQGGPRPRRRDRFGRDAPADERTDAPAKPGRPRPRPRGHCGRVSPMPLTILLNGSAGRMGQAVAAAAPGMGVTIAAAVDVGGDPSADVGACDVIIDFSSPSATRSLLELAIARKKPLVIGTTGHPEAERPALRALAARVPCVWAGNFSVGVNLLFALTRRAAQILGPDYDAEVVEMHHRFKKDAPSGTAARLLEIILEERKLGAGALRHGREGMVGARTDGSRRPFAARRRRRRRSYGDVRRSRASAWS